MLTIMFEREQVLPGSDPNEPGSAPITESNEKWRTEARNCLSEEECAQRTQ